MQRWATLSTFACVLSVASNATACSEQCVNKGICESTKNHDDPPSAWHRLWHPPETPEERREKMMQQYTANTKPCAAGQAAACAKLAEAQIFFKDSPAAIGKNFGVACSARPPNRVTGDAFYCLQAGEYAELPSGAGPAAALAAYADGCSLGNFASCEAARRLDPRNTEHYASQGCTAGHATSCTILASIYADPQNPNYNIARAKEILVNACRFTNDACAALGKLEVQETTTP